MPQIAPAVAVPAPTQTRKSGRISIGALILLAPGLIALLLLLFLPLINIAIESFRPYVPGKIGGATDAPFTLNNYIALLHPVYIGYLGTMIWCASVATLAGLVAAYPIAYVIARTKTHAIRIGLIGLLVGLLAVRVGKKIVWDVKQMRADGCPEADAFIRPKFRPGWEI